MRDPYIDPNNGKEQNKKRTEEPKGLIASRKGASNQLYMYKMMYEHQVWESNLKVRVVKRAHMPLNEALHMSDPFKLEKCHDSKKNCMVCSTGGRGHCWGDNVTYELKCHMCQMVYIGQTARNS